MCRDPWELELLWEEMHMTEVRILVDFKIAVRDGRVGSWKD